MTAVVLFVGLGVLAWRAARWLADEWAPPYDAPIRTGRPAATNGEVSVAVAHPPANSGTGEVYP